jgi:hypothetical protein
VGGNTGVDAMGMSAGGAGGGSGSEPDDTLASFDTVRFIIDATRCVDISCHGEQIQPTILDDPELYDTLLTYTVERCENRVLVVPGQPENSALPMLLREGCGELPQMPLGCASSNLCVPDSYIAGIEQWIADGAPQ